MVWPIIGANITSLRQARQCSRRGSFWQGWHGNAGVVPTSPYLGSRRLLRAQNSCDDPAHALAPLVHPADSTSFAFVRLELNSLGDLLGLLCAPISFGRSWMLATVE